MLRKEALKRLREKYGKRKSVIVDAMFFFIYKNDFLQWLAKYESRVLESKNYSIFGHFKDIYDEMHQAMVLHFYFKELFPRPPIKEEIYRLRYHISRKEEELQFIGTLQEIEAFLKGHMSEIFVLILENRHKF